MLEQTTAQPVKASGIYRCTGLGQTLYHVAGEPFQTHECDKGTPCRWMLLKHDNMSSDDAIALFIGTGIIHAIETDELPEVGAIYNIRQALGCVLETGAHRVTSVDEHFKWQGKEGIRMFVERIGDLSDELPIHQAHQVTI